jgi:hypothetical protein
MIEPPVRVGRTRGRVGALLVLGLALVIPLAALAARAQPPVDRSTAPASSARAQPAAATPVGSPTITSLRRVVTLAPGPMAVAVGDGSVWIAVASRDEIVRVAPDGTVDGAPISLAASDVAPAQPAGDVPTIGLADGSIWVAGVAAPDELDLVDPVARRVTRRVRLPTRALGLAGGLGHAWVVGADGRVLRIDPGGGMRAVSAAYAGEVHLAVGTDDVWVSRGHEVLAIRPDDLRVERRFATGGGAIAVEDGSAWALSDRGYTLDIVRFDERTLRIVDEEDVRTTGYSSIAWALPTVRATAYADADSPVAPHEVDSAIVGDVAWIARPVEGQLWRVERPAPGAP